VVRLVVDVTLCFLYVYGRLSHISLVYLEAVMQTINIHEVKTHLSRLVEQVVNGEPFVIAKAGKPLVKVVPLNAPDAGQIKRLGFMAGQIYVPDDFDQIGQAEIKHLFEGGE